MVSRQAGAIIEANKERGVYVPEGMIREELLVAGEAVIDTMELVTGERIDAYGARQVARAVITALAEVKAHLAAESIPAKFDEAVQECSHKPTRESGPKPDGASGKRAE